MKYMADANILPQRTYGYGIVFENKLPIMVLLKKSIAAQTKSTNRNNPAVFLK
jgi:hypothetical protein